MYEQEIKRVGERFLALHAKHPDYTVLSITQGMNMGRPYEHWNIYTPVLSHNGFKNSDDICSFIQSVIDGGDEHYRLWNLKKKQKELTDHQEQIEELQKEISDLMKGGE